MIGQIRHLQSRQPFETFALELANGRVIQIHDSHTIATLENVHHGAGVVGVLYENGFEVLKAEEVVSVSVGVHPKFKAERESAKEMFEDEL